MEDAELLRQALYAKQGRSSQFRNREERDAWLRKEIQEIDQTVTTQQQQVNDQNKLIINLLNIININLYYFG